MARTFADGAHDAARAAAFPSATEVDRRRQAYADSREIELARVARGRQRSMDDKARRVAHHAAAAIQRAETMRAAAATAAVDAATKGQSAKS